MKRVAAGADDLDRGGGVTVLRLCSKKIEPELELSRTGMSWSTRTVRIDATPGLQTAGRWCRTAGVGVAGARWKQLPGRVPAFRRTPSEYSTADSRGRAGCRFQQRGHAFDMAAFTAGPAGWARGGAGQDADDGEHGGGFDEGDALLGGGWAGSSQAPRVTAWQSR